MRRFNRLNYFIDKHMQKCDDERELDEFLHDINQAVREVSYTASMMTLQRFDQELAADRDWKARMKNVFYFGTGGIISWLIF